VIPAGAVTPSCDPGREIPAEPGARLDQVAAALASLVHERRRCERLGLEIPLARVEAQLRYWRFLEGLFSAAGEESAR
jgi:hypothetical protein